MLDAKAKHTPHAAVEMSEPEPAVAPLPPPFATPSTAEKDFVERKVIKREQFSEEQELLARALREAAESTMSTCEETTVNRPMMPRRHGFTTVIMEFIRENPRLKFIMSNHRWSGVIMARAEDRPMIIWEPTPDSLTVSTQLRVWAMKPRPGDVQTIEKGPTPRPDP